MLNFYLLLLYLVALGKIISEETLCLFFGDVAVKPLGYSEYGYTTFQVECSVSTLC